MRARIDWGFMSAVSRGSHLLSAYLAAQGCSQETLAKLIGADQSTLSRWASGKQKPTTKWALRMRDSFGIPIESWEEVQAPSAEVAA